MWCDRLGIADKVTVVAKFRKDIEFDILVDDAVYSGGKFNLLVIPEGTEICCREK